jgi:hypothetical protein
VFRRRQGVKCDQWLSGNKLRSMRDIEDIDSELRLLAAVRRTARDLTGRIPSTVLIDNLLDERCRVDPTS